uniref:Uncharacterized protein n=1 Tax=Candidatus Kentrum sp. LPFa TaxID=2126335 RepID=A0A450WEN7_9GAMM|nr:MAG: hypothetical protein BECKLPF1236B_GA0070989_107811 [Candidatus Kentron sp. LPFa]
MENVASGFAGPGEKHKAIKKGVRSKKEQYPYDNKTSNPAVDFTDGKVVGVLSYDLPTQETNRPRY